MTHIEKLHLEAIDNNICSESNYSRILGKNEAASKSAEITEQIACGFAEWIERKKLDSSGKHLHILRLLPKELFQEYLKSKENEQKKEG